MTTAVKSMLITRQVTALTAACITDLDAADTTRAGVVQAGKEYTDESAKDRIIILALDSHPAETRRWMDEVKDHEDDLGFKLPENGRGLLGGIQWNVIRGCVKVMINLSHAKISGSDALNIRQVVLSRVKSTLQQSATMKGFTDDFGERVHYFKVARQPAFDLVGPNYEAYVDWAALTTMPR